MPESNQSRKVFETSASTAREAMGKATATADQAARQVEQSYSFAADGIRDLNTKLLDIAQTNTLASLNFFSELMRTKGPTEAFELWSRHVQDHFERCIAQSQELATLGQKIASSSTEPLARGLDPTFKRAS